MPEPNSSSELQFLPASGTFSAQIFHVLLRAASRSAIWFFLLAVVGTVRAQTSPVTLYAALSANPVLLGSSPAAIAVIGCASACGTMTYLMDGQTFQVIPVNADGTIAFPPISSTLAVGSHTLTVQYSGNATYSATSTSYSFTVVSAAPTSLTLSLNTTPVPVNETPQMSGQLGCNSACGNVYYAIDGTTFQNSTASPTGLVGNLLQSQIALGWHVLTESYPGNSTYSASSTSIAFHVIPDTLPPVSLAIALPSAPYVTGTSPNVITAIDCRGICSGYLTWYMDGQLFQNWGPINVAAGIVSPPLLNGETIAVGSHSLSVKYSGDSQNAPTSASYTFNAVTATPTSLILSLPYNPVPSDETPIMTGQIGCNTSCGNVYYYIDGTIFQNSTARTDGSVGNLLTPLPPLPYSEVAPGWHILTESYPGNSTYSASSVSIPFQIVPDTLPVPSLTATLPTNPVIFGTAPNLTTTVGCGSNCSGQLTWYMDGTLFQNWGVASNGVDSPSIVNGPALTMGPHTITIHYGGNAQYAPTTTSLSFVVTQATHGTVPVVTWAKPAAVSYGATLSSTQLNATASVPGTFAYSPATGTMPATGNDVLTVTFAPTDTTDYVTTAQSVVLAVNKAVPTITWSQPAPITFGNQLTANQLNATSTISGTMSYSPTLDSIPSTGIDQLTATFTPNDYTDYKVATQNVNLTVNKAAPTITWATPAAITYGTALTSAQLNATASVTGTFAYSPAMGSVPVVGNDALTVTFTPTDTTDYNTATASVSLVVNQASQTITFTAPATPVTYGVAPITLSAAASSGLPVIFDVTSGPATVSGSTLTITGGGTVVVAANQSGNANYSAAASVSYNIVVNQAPLISISDIPSSATYGGSFTATYSYSGSGSPTESVSSISPSVCMVTGNIVSYVGIGTCILQASATATPGYTAATGSTQRFTVTRAMLTVTASNASRVYGVANPTFTPAYSGFVNGDTQSVLNGSPILTASATTSSTVGTYTITAATGSLGAANYTFNYVNGALTITQATPVITWAQPFNVQPGTALSAAQLNAAANAPGSFSYSPATGTVLASGSHILSATFTPSSSTNYSTANATVTLTVSFSPNAGIITTVAGSGTAGYGGNGGAAASALLDNPTGVSVDASGNIYLADSAYGYIRKVNSATGIITNLAGNGQPYSANGPASSTGLGIPVGIALDTAGNVYIADGYQSRVLKLTISTGMITNIAGNGTGGWAGDGGAATNAFLNSPSGLAVDASGNLYIADGYVIRKVNTAGIISTVAGNETYGYSGDNGSATSAALNIPMGVSVDRNGNIYIADWKNNRIRKVNTSGIITTIAGNGTAGYSGDGGIATSAELNAPNSVYVDTSGNVFIADGGNNRIREVNAAGVITTVAGNGTPGYSGDGGIATSGELNLGNASGEVFVDSNGTIYVSDSSNNRIRAVGPTSNAIGITVTTSGSPSAYGNPVTFTAAVPSGDTNTVTFYSGSNPLGTATPSNGIASLTISSLAVGVNPITAGIAGSGSYPAATSALIDQVVNQLASTITISNIPSSAGYGGSFTATYSYSGNGSPSVSSSTPSVCSVSDSTVNYLNPGTCTLQASVSATADYAAATGGSQSFTVSPPTIGSLSPTSGSESTTVTISGLGFGLSPDTTTVAFNGVLANLSSWTNTSLVTKVPIGATTGNVVVTANGTASNGILFTVNATTPTITSLSASSGNVGLAVTISGSGFGAREGQSTATFNGITAGVLNWSDSAIIAIVPFGATTGPIIVTRSDGQKSNANIVFTVASGAICNY